MAKPDAATLRADSEATAELPTDDAGVDEHLHATPEHPWLLCLRAGRTTAANPPAVDGAGPATTADLPAASPTAAAGLPADGAGVDEHLHADVQHPPVLSTGRDAPCPGRHATNPTGEIKKTKGEAP